MRSAASGVRSWWDASALNARSRATRSARRRAVSSSAIETLLAAGVGVVAGLAIALAVGASQFGTASFGAGSQAALLWAAGAALVGLTIAAASIALPARRDARALTVAVQRQQLGRNVRSAWWARYGLDVICLVGGAIVYCQASRYGYNLVLAPEGVPQISVNWYALLAPVLC